MGSELCCVTEARTPSARGQRSAPVTGTRGSCLLRRKGFCHQCQTMAAWPRHLGPVAAHHGGRTWLGAKRKAGAGLPQSPARAPPRDPENPQVVLGCHPAHQHHPGTKRHTWPLGTFMTQTASVRSAHGPRLPPTPRTPWTESSGAEEAAHACPTLPAALEPGSPQGEWSSPSWLGQRPGLGFLRRQESPRAAGQWSSPPPSFQEGSWCQGAAVTGPQLSRNTGVPRQRPRCGGGCEGKAGLPAGAPHLRPLGRRAAAEVRAAPGRHGSDLLQVTSSHASGQAMWVWTAHHTGPRQPAADAGTGHCGHLQALLTDS